MLDPKFVRHNLGLVQTALKNRGEKIILDEFVQKYDLHKIVVQQLDRARHERNTISDQIGTFKKNKISLDPNLITKSRELGRQIKGLEEEQETLQGWLSDFLLTLPNIPHFSVPVGETEKENVVVKVWGQKPIWSPGGILLFNGAGKRMISGFQMLLLRARAFLGN